MIFEKLTLSNFGVYKGTQTIQLSPKKNKPIILFGGFNGGGKTTLLDALQLGLYGKSAQTSNRKNYSYQQYIHKCFHKSADPTEPFAIEVQFRFISEGKEESYKIHRSWVLNGKDYAEYITVFRNDTEDSLLTESWTEVIEEFVPVKIANLFFFDGEKIETFADLDNSSLVLTTTINSLLGLDLVDQLEKDLTALERRKMLSKVKDHDLVEIDKIKLQINEAEQIREDLALKRASLQNEFDLLNKRLRDIESRYKNEGGGLYEKQHELEENKSVLENQVKDIETTLREVAAGSAPLLLNENLLQSILSQDAEEQKANRSKLVFDVIVKRDEAVLNQLSKEKISNQTINKVEAFLKKERGQHHKESKFPCYLYLNDETRNRLTFFLKQESPFLIQEIKNFLVKLKSLRSELVEVERKISSIPNSETIEPLRKDLTKIRDSLYEIQQAMDYTDVQSQKTQQEIDQKKLFYTKSLGETVDLSFQKDDLRRIIIHSQKVRGTLQKFREKVIEKHVKKIELLILDSFRQLIRKASLITEVRISPHDFCLELFGADKKKISPDRLSAGERQLLAISILWGLARTSGRPLPAVIDTPLGRLDTAHRTHLIERYFPYASHQVMLLSTDEEINKEYYKKLKPWIDRAYYLNYNENSDSTQIQEGYFWE